MQSKNRILDDMARMTTGALGTLADLRKELEVLAKAQFDKLLSNMDLVTREEFETVRAMAEKARGEQEDLRQQVVVLQAAMAARTAEVPKKAAKKAAPRKSTAKPASKKSASAKKTTTKKKS